MWVCTATAIGTEPAPQRASSSMKRRLAARSPSEPPQRDGVVQTEEAQLAATPEDRVGEEPCCLPLVDVGTHLGVHVATHARPQLLVLLAEDRVTAHGYILSTFRSVKQ